MIHPAVLPDGLRGELRTTRLWRRGTEHTTAYGVVAQ